MTIQLRPYQKNILRKLIHSFKSNHARPLIQAPCGSGKTVIFSEVARLATSQGFNVIALVHRRELMHQTERTLRSMGVTEVSVHMAQTYSRRLGQYPKPDLIITDEAHLAVARTWQKIYDYYPNAKVIGFSATPCRLDQKPLGDVFDDLIEEVDTRYLIENGYLSDYKYYSVSVPTLTELNRKGSDFDQKQATELLDSNIIYGDVLNEYRTRANHKRTVVYCSTVEHSKRTAEYFTTNGYRAEHIDGTVSQKKRDEIINRFRTGETEILTNVNIVAEGFDLPAIECVIMLRPTMSTSLYVQQSGRALRPAEDKTAIIIDCVGNYLRHGLPDDDREWSLTTKISERKQTDDQGLLTIRLCQECYSVYKASQTHCPNCETEYELTPTEIQNQVDIKLEQIEREEEQKLKQYLFTDEALKNARSYSDLMKIANARGYKRGWAWHRAKKRGYWTPY